MEHDPHDHRGHEVMMNVMYGKEECLRFGSTRFLDGKGKRCCDDPQAIPCSHCQTQSTGHQIQGRSVLGKRTCRETDNTRRSVLGKRTRGQTDNTKTAEDVREYMKDTFGKTTKSSKRQRVVRVQELDSYVVKFKAALSKFNGMCAFCKVWGHDVARHSILHCPSMVENEDINTSSQTYREWLSLLKYEFKKHGKICYFCHIPQCNDALHDTFMPSAGSCEHKNIVPGVAYGIFHHNKWRNRAERQFSQRWLSEVQFSIWLNSTPIKGHKTNMTALFLWFSDQI
jgi:hypothetical protein